MTLKQDFFSRSKLWLYPLLCVLAITPFTPWLDLELSEFAFKNNVAGYPFQSPHGFSSNCFFNFLFRFGSLPAQLVGGTSTLFVLYSIIKKKYLTWRKIALILSLTFLLGSGLISYVLCKEGLVRPRPYKIEQFGGTLPFFPCYSPGVRPFCTLPKIECTKSFPSGHATSGFYFLSLFFVGRRAKKKWLERGGLLFGLLFGLLLSLARILQGGHFFSDVLFAALIMWECAYFADWFVFSLKPSSLLLKKVKNVLDEAPYP